MKITTFQIKSVFLDHNGCTINNLDATVVLTYGDTCSLALLWELEVSINRSIMNNIMCGPSVYH